MLLYFPSCDSVMVSSRSVEQLWFHFQFTGQNRVRERSGQGSASVQTGRQGWSDQSFWFAAGKSTVLLHCCLLIFVKILY